MTLASGALAPNSILQIAIRLMNFHRRELMRNNSAQRASCSHRVAFYALKDAYRGQ